eukprot:g15661.t1
MGTTHTQADDDASAEAAEASREIDPNESVVVLTDEIQAIRMHQLAISLRPLPGSSGRPMVTASRWEVRKAIMSLCCTPPTTFEIEATDKSASIRVAFSARAAAEDLSLKLRGTTVKIKGVKLHAFVREVSESSVLSEGEDWADSLPGSKVLSIDGNGGEGDSTAREAAFGRLEPGKRPDTIVLRGLPANWLGLGSRGKAAEGTDAPGLELMMSRLGPVRAVDVIPSAPRDSDLEPPADGDGSRHNNHHHTKNAKKSAAGAADSDFDVNALLSNMPKPRALAKGNKGGGGGGGGGGRASVVGRSSSASGGGGVREALSVALHVDAWVQFSSFRGFRRALSALRGRVLKKAGAELLCEYRLGVDVTGFMTEEQRRARGGARAKKAQEEERRKASIEKARGQLTLLREGLQSLRDAAEEDGRPALEDAVKPTIRKVTEHVERAEALLGVRHDAFVDEKAATAAVSTARGEIAIARLSIRKARAAVDRAEEEERKRIEREKDKGLRDAARATLRELEESLSQGLALVPSEREHPGIKPQADTAMELLDKLSDACSREGGGSEAFGADGAGGSGGGGLVADARRATEKAVTRACMLQRYLDTSARLESLRVMVNEALLPSSPPLEAAGDSNGSGGNTITTATTTTGGGGILSAQVDVATAILSRELQELSEGDLLLIWERAEEALDVADGMLETYRLVESARHRLADAKAAVAGGDSVLRTSEGIMRLVAAAAMSMARAQREGAAAVADVVPEALALASAAERWRSAAVSADSDARAAAHEVERVAGELRDKRQREEEEKAWRKAEEERRLREAEAQRLERQARAAEREALEKRQAEARIFAMELRRKEMTAQVRNKGARRRLQEQFRAQRAASGASDARGGKKSSTGSEHTEPPPIADRWTLEEGLAAEGTDNVNGSAVPSTAAAPPPPATATAQPTSTFNGSRSGVANTRAAAERGDPAPRAAGAALPPGEDRWTMSDGAADLAERGVELEMDGAGLPAPLSSLSPPFFLGAGWLELVSKRVRSSVVGGAEAGSWGAEAPIDESDAAGGGGGGAGQSLNGVGSAAADASAAPAEGKGGEIEAKLRQRLLAAMMGKSKAKAKPKVEQ